MFNKIKLVLNNPTLLKRIGFTLLILFIYKLGTYVAIPLVNVEGLRTYITSNDFFAILNAFSGEALGRFSILALGISPYITASIVVQLLQMDIIKVFKEWSEQGETGKQKLNQVTRYAAVALAFIQSLTLLLGLSQSPSNILAGTVIATPLIYVYMSLVITAGTAIVLWLADLITRKGIGNGSSLIITAGILTSLPSMVTTLYNKYIVGGTNWKQYILFGLILLLYIGIIIGVIFMEAAKRKIPIQYANRQGKSDSNIPIKLNSAGVIPVIFSATILSIPQSIIGLMQLDKDTNNWAYWIDQIFNYRNPLGMILYISLIYLFSFFYAFLTVDPVKIADNLTKSNAYIPGVRPGEDTQNFIARLLFRITLIGATYLTILAIIPIFTAIIFNFTNSEAQIITLGGTSLLIVVGVAIETTKQVETDAADKTYSGFIK